MTLRYLMTIKKGGRVYRYLRKPGAKPVRLPDLPTDHPEFLAAYAAAMQGGPVVRAKPGTVAAMVSAAMAAPDFLALAPAYIRAMQREMREIAAKGGTALARDLEARHIRADMSGLEPHRAVKRLKAWRLICKRAVDTGLIAADPSLGVSRPRTPQTDGHEPWTRDQVAAFRAHWPIGTMQRAAFELLHWTGARISDAVRLGPGMIDRAGVLTYRQEKTGGAAHIPWTSPLPAWAQGMEADRAMMLAALDALPARHMTWLATAQGRSRSKKALGGYISDAAKAAGIARSAHGLRKSRASALAEAGADVLALQAWIGHASIAESARYTRKADRRRAVMGTEHTQTKGIADGTA